MIGPRYDAVIGTERITVHRREADGILGKQARTSIYILSTHIKVVHAPFHRLEMTCPLLEGGDAFKIVGFRELECRPFLE